MDFGPLTEYLDRLPAEGVPGCDLIVRVGYDTVYRHQAGESAPGIPVRGGEMYWLYSATKLITMTVAMRLIEMGVLRLNDAVADYLPAYARLTVREGDTVRPARTVMTFEHLLAMQGGLDYDLEAPGILEGLKDPEASTIAMVQRFPEKPLHFDPGTGFKYSLCHDVAAAVMMAATGKSLSRLADELVFEPLGIRDLTFHPTPAQQKRLAVQYGFGPDGAIRPIPNRIDDLFLMPNYESGGAGLMGDADSYIVLAEALANDGVGATGERILTKASIDDMRTNRQTGKCMEDFRLITHKRGYGYGLGVRTLIDKASSRSPLGEFGWDGAAGAWVMADPEHRLSAFFVMHVLNWPKVYHVFHPAVRDLIYDCLGMGS